MCRVQVVTRHVAFALSTLCVSKGTSSHAFNAFAQHTWRHAATTRFITWCVAAEKSLEDMTTSAEETSALADRAQVGCAHHSYMFAAQKFPYHLHRHGWSAA